MRDRQTVEGGAGARSEIHLMQQFEIASHSRACGIAACELVFFSDMKCTKRTKSLVLSSEFSGAGTKGLYDAEALASSGIRKQPQAFQLLRSTAREERARGAARHFHIDRWHGLSGAPLCSAGRCQVLRHLEFDEQNGFEGHRLQDRPERSRLGQWARVRQQRWNAPQRHRRMSQRGRASSSPLIAPSAYTRAGCGGCCGPPRSGRLW